MSDAALVVHDLHAGYENVLVLRGVSLRADGDEIGRASCRERV